jgi:hypothetical protein
MAHIKHHLLQPVVERLVALFNAEDAVCSAFAALEAVRDAFLFLINHSLKLTSRLETVLNLQKPRKTAVLTSQVLRLPVVICVL